MTGEEKLLTSDTRGRVRVSVERREALLDEFERSGLSGLKFAQLAGVKYPTFALWVQKRRKAREMRGEDGVAGVKLVEAVVDRGSGLMGGAAGLTIELPGGARMEVNSPVQLQMAAELLRLVALSGSRGC